MNNFYTIKQLLLDGVEFTYGKLTLCDLSKYSDFRGQRRFQVYCDESQHQFHNVYLVKDIDHAVAKFLELKASVDSKIRYFVRKKNYE